MKKIKIEFKTENAIFEYPIIETKLILEKLIKFIINNGLQDKIIMDSNGNTIGKLTIK